MKRIFSLLLITILFWVQVSAVYAAAMGNSTASTAFFLSGDTQNSSNLGKSSILGASNLIPPCETPSQLLELISQNEGGKVTLTNNILWNTYDSIDVTSPTEIDMGPYGILVSGCTFIATGPLTFLGQGIDSPLFSTDETGSIFLAGVTISSTGNYGVSISLNNGNNIAGHNNIVEALGENAIAISSMSALDLVQYRAEAPNTGSIAIQAPDDVSLLFCNILGTIKADGNILLNHTKVDSMPVGAQVTNNIIQPMEFAYGYTIEVGTSFYPPDYISLLDPDIDSDIYSPDTYKSYYLPVTWALDSYDEETPGTYSIKYSLVSDLLDIEFTGTVPLHVIDPNLPWLKQAYGSIKHDVFIDLYRSLGDADDIRVIYSSDSGESWDDAFSEFKVSIEDFFIRIGGLDPESTHWFRVIVDGGKTAGTSNIIKLWLNPLIDSGPDPQDNKQLPPNKPTAPDGPIMTASDLVDALAENDGGTVVLTGNVILDSISEMEVTNPTTVQMGDYSITVLGYGRLTYIRGPIHFIGNGNVRPLFNVKHRGQLIFHGTSTVTATEKDGIAVFGQSNLYIEDGEIYAPLGTGVYANDMAVLFYSYVSGTKSVVSKTNKISLNSTLVFPQSENAKITEQTAIITNYYELDRYGIFAAQGDEFFDPNDIDGISFTFLNNEHNEFTSFFRNVEWELSEDFDIQTVGEYSVSLTPTLSPHRMNVKGYEQHDIPIFVVDPSKPRLTHALKKSNDRIDINYFELFENTESMTLRYSLDQGDTWTDISDSQLHNSHFTISEFGIFDLYLPDLTKDSDIVYWFQLEVKGGETEGLSNILKVWYSPYYYNGGDRTGADRFPNMDSELGNGQDDASSGSSNGNNSSDKGNGRDSADTTPTRIYSDKGIENDDSVTPAALSVHEDYTEDNKATADYQIITDATVPQYANSAPQESTSAEQQSSEAESVDSAIELENNEEISPSQEEPATTTAPSKAKNAIPIAGVFLGVLIVGYLFLRVKYRGRS